MALSPKEKEFYAQIENTFLTPGWELIKRGFATEQEALPVSTFFNAKSIDDLRAARVRYGVLTELINLPETLAQQKLNVEQGNDQDDE